MEFKSTRNIFVQSITRHGLNYTKLYGNGDNKSHKSIDNVYGEDMKVERLHCVGHIQNCVVLEVCRKPTSQLTQKSLR